MSILQNVVQMAQNRFARIYVTAGRADLDLLPLSAHAESTAADVNYRS